MRGEHHTQLNLFSTKPLEKRVPHAHPLRKLRVIVDTALRALDREFDAMYSSTGRPSIPPERLLRALLVQSFFSVRSERLLMEQIDYNLLFRWFIGLDMDDAVWDASTFSANRERLLNQDIARRFFEQVLSNARALNLLSDEHFSVDGTLIEALGSLKSVVPKSSANDDDQDPNQSGGRNGWKDFKNQQRSNDTHASSTDPEAKLACKGAHQTVELSWTAHTLMENRNGLIVDAMVTSPSGKAEREAAEKMAGRSILQRGATLGADRGYDTSEHVKNLKQLGVRSHAARKTHCRSAIDGRTAAGKGYAISQKVRKRIEETFAWIKDIAGMRKSRFFGQERSEMAWLMAASSYNLVRMMSIFGWRNGGSTRQLRPA
jgi:transposase